MHRAIALCALVWMATACQVTQPFDQVPAYIQIDSTSFLGSAETGPVSINLPDVWIFANSQLIGAFEVPCRVPVLLDGTYPLQIYGGTFSDGVRSLRINYPFYAGHELDTLFQPGETLRIKPTFSYLPSSRFIVYEDFETNNRRVDSLGTNTTLPLIVGDSSFKAPNGGTQSAVMKAPADGQFRDLIMATKGLISIGQGERPTYLELDYQNNIPITVGLIGYDENDQFIGNIFDLVLRERDDWNKVYVFLTDETRAFPAGTRFKVYIQGQADGSTPAHIAIDNFRLVSF